MKTLVTIIAIATAASCNNNQKESVAEVKEKQTVQHQETTPADETTPAEVQPPAPDPAPEPSKPPTTPAPKQETDNYRLTVSFISKASGIDLEAHERFMKVIEGHSPKVAYEEARWGREGEVDYCFKLSELSPAQQKQLVSKIRETAGKNDLIFISENAPCVHKR